MRSSVKPSRRAAGSRSAPDAVIGTILSVSSRTVAKHLEHIYQRLGVENRSAAVALALTTPLATS